MPATPISRDLAPVTRADAGTDIAWMAGVAVVTILATRGYLVLTGYPQIGGEVFHIAHAVWGGLLLMVAVVLQLGVANRWAVRAAAVTGGLGAGLFVDEIGKFITQDNDYFFPLAAPLTYALMALLGAAAVWFGGRRRGPREHLYAALELLVPVADGPLTHEQLRTVHRHLDLADGAEAGAQHHAVVVALRQALEVAEQRAVPEEATRVGRLRRRVRELEQRLLPPDRARRLVRWALGLLAVLGLLAGPGVLVYALWQLFGPRPLAGNNSLLGGGLGPVAWTAAALAAALGLVAGFLAARAVRRLGDSSPDPVEAVRPGAVALLLLLGGTNLLTAYFSQFSVLLDASAQAGTLALLLRLRQRWVRERD